MRVPAASTACEEQGIDTDACDIETALNHVGVGRFQWAALAVCGAANAADAVEILGMSLVLPAAEADPGFELGPGGKSALSSCIFLGMLAGGLLWGPMGDALGRRVSLIAALLINAFFGLMSAGARGVGPLVLLRLLGGVGVGGSVPVVFAFLSELLPARARGRFMVGLAAHWMVGSIFSAGMGWAIIPTGPGRWRVFLAVASLPAWCAALGAWLLPESPRHLLVQGHTHAAEQVLHKMAAINGRRPVPPLRLLPHKSHHLPLAPSRPPSSHLTTPPPAPAAAAPATPTLAPAAGLAPDPGVLPSHAAATGAGAASGTAAAAAASSSGGAQGPDMSWHHARGRHSQSSSPPTARARRLWGSGTGQPPGSEGPGACRASGGGRDRQQQLQLQQQQRRRCCRSSLVSAGMLLVPPLRRRFLPLLVAWLGLCGGWYSTVLWIPEFFKARGAQPASLYAETFAVAAANLPGNIASIFMVDLLGRRLTACICLAGSCVAALAFAFAPPQPLWSVAAGCLFNAISVGGWNALDLLSAECFATEVRSTAMGLLGAAGRLAAFSTTFLAGALMQRLVWSPLLVAAGLLAAGSAAIMLLPEMAHRPLEDTVEDAEDAEVTLSMLTAPPPEPRASLAGAMVSPASGGSAAGGGGYQGCAGGGEGTGSAGLRDSRGAAGIELQQAGGVAAAVPGSRAAREPGLREERLGLLAAAPREP